MWAGNPRCASAVSVACPARPVPYLKLGNHFRDVSPHSPRIRKRSPSMQSSVSMFCSSLAGASQRSAEPAPPRNPSPRYELAAIALLSTVPLRREGLSRSRVAPPELRSALRRPASPLSYKAAASGVSVSGHKESFGQRNEASPPTTQDGWSGRRPNEYVMACRGLQAASPVPTKCGSFLPSSRLGAPNPTILHESEREGQSLQPPVSAGSYYAQPTIPESRVVDSYEAADAPFRRIRESVARGSCRPAYHEPVEGTLRVGVEVDARARFTSFPSATHEWKIRGRSVTLENCSEDSAGPARDGQSRAEWQGITTGEAEAASHVEKELRLHTCVPRHQTLRSQCASPASSAWSTEGTREAVQPRPHRAGDNAETTRAAAVAFSASRRRISRLSFEPTHLCLLRQHRPTRRRDSAVLPDVGGRCRPWHGANNDTCFSPSPQPQVLLPHSSMHGALDQMRRAGGMFYHGGDCRRPEPANEEMFFLPSPKPPRLSAHSRVGVPLGQVNRAGTVLCHGGRGVDTAAHHRGVESPEGSCLRRTGLARPEANDLRSSLRRTGLQSSPLFRTSHCEHVIGTPVSDTEVVSGCEAQCTPAPNVSCPSHAERRRLHGDTSTTLHAEDDNGERSLGRVLSSAGSVALETPTTTGLAHTARGQNSSSLGVALATYQDPWRAVHAASVFAADEGRNPLLDVDVQVASASTCTGSPVGALLAAGPHAHAVRDGDESMCTSVSTGVQRHCKGEREDLEIRLKYHCTKRDDGMRDLVMAECDPGSVSEQQISVVLKEEAGRGDGAKKAVVTGSAAADTRDGCLFSELRHTLRKLRAHRTALHARDVIFDTSVRQDLLPLEGSLERTAEGGRNTCKKRRPVLPSQAGSVTQALQYSVLEEGSFGRVFAGRFLGKLQTTGVRRWSRRLPLCEGFLRTAACSPACALGGLLPLHVQDAIENNVRVAIKVPVEATVLRDPLGTLARTLNEWKILVLVHEKRKMVFWGGGEREGGGAAVDDVAKARRTPLGTPVGAMESYFHSNDDDARAAAPTIFCQDQLYGTHGPSFASGSWHPMHPRAEPPGIVELVGGVVHGPLDVWLVTRLAAGKDLHTRKYSRSLADGLSIPPAAGLAMCRQLAAIVDFLHMRTRRSGRRQCVAVRDHQQGSAARFSEEFLEPGGRRKGVAGGFGNGFCMAVAERSTGLHSDSDFPPTLGDAPVIVHRDIKPENIIVDDDWRIQLCDFGDAEASPDGIVSRVSGATWLYAPVELLCPAFLDNSRDEHCVDREDLSHRECGRGLRSSLSHVQADGTRSVERARSCPAFADAASQAVDDSLCSGAESAATRPNSFYRSMGRALTEKWDIWSMGCVFQEMFGLPNPMSPYVRPSDPPHVVYEKLKKKAHSGQLVPVVAPEIQGIARQIIYACLRSDPKARPSATAVLRMWSAPEEEILKDICIPAACPVAPHPAPCVGTARTGVRETESPSEPCTPPPPAGARVPAVPSREQHKESGDQGRFLARSLHASCDPEGQCSREECSRSATVRVTGGEGQEDVYVVPNLAVVREHSEFGVQYTGVKAWESIRASPRLYCSRTQRHCTTLATGQ